jgi:zinc protease
MTEKNIISGEIAPDLHKTTLDNGITLITRQTPELRVATVQIWVKTGSIDEKENEAGITHLIEHMIFKGTESRGPGEIAGNIEELGGKINAYTSYESTVYHATLPVRHWELAAEVLVDALCNSIFDEQELEREKLVVLEEEKMRSDNPAIKLFEGLMSTAYSTHPYGLPIIGNSKQISAFKREDLKNYMARRYHPENLAVVLVGDISHERASEKIKDLFKLKQGKKPVEPRVFPKEQEQKEVKFFNFEQDIKQAHIAMAFPTVCFSTPEAVILDVLSYILGSGETSRLYRKLRDELKIVYQISSSSFTPLEPGLLEITAALDTENINNVYSAVLEEIFKFKYHQVSTEELERAKLNIESNFIFGQERIEGKARILGSFEFLTGDPRHDNYLKKLQSVTAEDIIEVAKKYFSPAKLTAGMVCPKGSDIKLNNNELNIICKKAEKNAEDLSGAALVKGSFLANVYSYKLDNGINLIVRESSQLPTVAIRCLFPGGSRAETLETNGAFSLISELLTTGTKTMTAHELAKEIGNMAGEIDGFSGKNTFGLKADFLARFFKPGLKLVRDILVSPVFTDSEAGKIRSELLSMLRQQEDSIAHFAFKKFNQLLFKEHPYALNTIGTEDVISNISLDSLMDIYLNSARPENLTIAIAGNIKAVEVKKAVADLFNDWLPEKEKIISKVNNSLLPLEPETPELIHLDREKEQVHIITGFLGTSIKTQDRYPLEILDSILSGQSGRLFIRLRDEQGLAYSISSFSLFGLDTGSIGIYLGTSPDKKDQAIKAVWKEIAEICQEMVSKDELAKAKNLLISQYELGLQTHGSQAMEVALVELYDLGQDFGHTFIREIKKVNQDDILRVAKKYLKPEHYNQVTAGA